MPYNAHAGPVRRGGTALLTPRSGPPAPSTRPQRAGLLAPNPSLARCSPTSPPRSHAPLAELGAAPRCLWERRERPQSKRSKEGAEEQGPGSCGLAWRWWCTERLRRLRGSRVALGLTPLVAPLPGSRFPLTEVPFSSPRALSAPAPGSVLGIKRKEGGGKGRRREREEEKRGRSLQRRVLSFSSGPSGHTARPLPALSPAPSTFRRRGGRPHPAVWCAHSWRSRLPTTPPPPTAPRLSASFSLAPHLSFPCKEGSAPFAFLGSSAELPLVGLSGAGQGFWP